MIDLTIVKMLSDNLKYINNFLPSLFIYWILVSTDTTGLDAILGVSAVELSPSVAFSSSEQRVSENVIALAESSCKQFTSVKATSIGL